MRIIHLDSDDLDNPLHGGQPVRTFEVNARLAARHEVKVLTATYPGCDRRRLERGRVAYERVGRYLPPFGLSPHFSFLAGVGPRLRREPHDLVVEEFTPPIGFGLAPMWTRRPVVLVVQWSHLASWEARYRLPLRRWMERVAQRGWYRHVIVQTEEARRVFESLLPRASVRRIPCGLDRAAFVPVEEGGGYALYLGRLAIEEKGVDLLLEAWQARCAAARIPLLIAGSGPDRAVLERRCAGLESLVRFVGHVDGEAKRALLRGCRLVVMPSRLETFGLVALEAMAAGKPVVAFDIDHLRELVRPAWGVAVPAADPRRLGDAVCRLWDDPAACRALGTRARVEAERYDWDRIAAAQEAFYVEALEGVP